MSEHYLRSEPRKKKRQYRCISLWAQHETQETASLIITYLSVCPPQGPAVTTADVLHWQTRNTHANSNTLRGKKKQCCYDYCRHSNSSLGLYNHDDQQCGKSASLLFYIWIPISLSDCEACLGSTFTFAPMGNLVSVACDCMFVKCRCGRKQAENLWSKGENICRSHELKANQLFQAHLFDLMLLQ